MYGAHKRKRGAGSAVLQAAQSGGDPARQAYVNALKAAAPHPSKRTAQSSLYLPKGRSGIRHLLKNKAVSGGGNERLASKANKIQHHHDIMRKYYRGKPSNGIKSYIKTYAHTA